MLGHIETSHALIDHPAAARSGAGAVSPACRSDRLRYLGHAHRHSRVAGNGAGNGYLYRHRAADDYPVFGRVGGRAAAVWPAVGSVRAATGAAGGYDVVHPGQRRHRAGADPGHLDRRACPAIHWGMRRIGAGPSGRAGRGDAGQGGGAVGAADRDHVDDSRHRAGHRRLYHRVRELAGELFPAGRHRRGDVAGDRAAPAGD